MNSMAALCVLIMLTCATLPAALSSALIEKAIGVAFVPLMPVLAMGPRQFRGGGRFLIRQWRAASPEVFNRRDGFQMVRIYATAVWTFSRWNLTGFRFVACVVKFHAVWNRSFKFFITDPVRGIHAMWSRADSDSRVATVIQNAGPKPAAGFADRDVPEQAFAERNYRTRRILSLSHSILLQSFWSGLHGALTPLRPVINLTLFKEWQRQTAGGNV